MPFVLAPMGAAGAALLAVLCAIALSFLIKAIASQVGNIKLPLGVVIHLGDILANAASSIEQAAVSAGVGLFTHIEQWVYGHAYALYNLADSTVRAIVNVTNHLAALADNVPIMIGYAEQLATQQVTNLGNAIEADVSQGVTYARLYLTAANRAVWEAASGLAQTVGGNLAAIASYAVDDAESYTDAAINNLTNYVNQQVTAAEKIASDALAQAQTQIGAAIAGVASTAAANLTSAENTLEGDINAAKAAASSALSSAETTIGGEITQTAATAASALASEATTLGGEIASTAATAASNLQAAEQSIQGTITGDITGLTSELDSDVGTLQGEIASEAQTFAGDLSNLQTVLTAAIASSIAGVAAQVAELEECAVTECEGPNNFGNLLQDALGIADFAAFAAFVAEAINSPSAAAGTFEDAAQGLYSDATSLMNTLLSL